MRRRSRAHGAVAVICAVSAGCSLAVSLDGLTGGGAAAPTDGGAEASTALASDAGDGAIDGAAADRFATDAPPVPFCPSHPGHSLCLSFDDPDSGVPASVALTPDAAVLALVPLGASPPNALRSYLPAAKADQYARSEIPIPSASTVIHWEASVKRGAVDPVYGSGGAFLSLLSFVCSTPGGAAGAFVHYVDGAIRLRRLGFDGDAGLDERRAVVPWPSDGAWHRVALDVALGGSGSAKVAVDGVAVAEITGGAFSCGGNTDKYVTAGMLANAGSADRPAYEALYDDFLGDWK